MLIFSSRLQNLFIEIASSTLFSSQTAQYFWLLHKTSMVANLSEASLQKVKARTSSSDSERIDTYSSRRIQYKNCFLTSLRDQPSKFEAGDFFSTVEYILSISSTSDSCICLDFIPSVYNINPSVFWVKYFI